MYQFNKNTFLFGLFLLFQCWTLEGLAQVMSAATDVKEAQSADAKTVKNLPANTAVKLIKREGFWVEIEAAGTKGWVKLTAVNMGSQAPKLSPVDTGRSGKGNIVSTSAARGLSAKDLTLSKPDPGQFAELQKLAINSAEADKFAKAAGLKPRQIALITANSKPTDEAKTKAKPSANKKPKKSDDDDDDD
jgi:hypothetical protein